MYKRAGGVIINGKKFWWTNWYIDEICLDQPMFGIESYTVPDEWLPEMFDNRHSAYLMPMPIETLN